MFPVLSRHPTYRESIYRYLTHPTTSFAQLDTNRTLGYLAQTPLLDPIFMVQPVLDPSVKVCESLALTKGSSYKADEF